MKRFIISFMAFLFSICMFVPMAAFAADDDYTNGDCMQAIYDAEANIGGQISDVSDKIDGIEKGASQESVDEIKESVDNIDVKQGVDDYFTEKATESSDETKDYGKSFADSVLGVLQSAWAELPKVLIGSDEGSWKVTLNPSDQYNGTFYGIFVTIGYSLVLVFFAANLIETTIKYEIFTLKGGVQIFGRLIVSKVIIDLSGKICIYILNICNYISKDILKSASNDLLFKMPNIFGNMPSSKIPFVGGLFDYFQGYCLIIPVLIIIIIMLIAALLIIFKLMLRSLELSLLMIVSPAFFACYSSEITKPYFKNFILTFLQCALQIVFMAIVYAISSSFISDWSEMYQETNVWTWFIRTIPKALIALAIAIMMIKPPKVLTGLVR